ncbi:hypothetical protein NKG94_04605 [Micromonospora sp. M12]
MPVLVVGQFAMLAIVPVTLALVASLRHAHLRGLRRWTAVLAAAYATPLILWAIGPDRARACPGHAPGLRRPDRRGGTGRGRGLPPGAAAGANTTGGPSNGVARRSGFRASM